MSDAGARAHADWDRLFDTYRDSGERTVRNRLVEAHRGLAASIANDYRGRGVELLRAVGIPNPESSWTTWSRSRCWG